MTAEEETGTPLQELLDRYRIGPRSHARAKARLAGLETSDLDRLRSLEADNDHLKAALAQQMVENSRFKAMPVASRKAPRSRQRSTNPFRCSKSAMWWRLHLKRP